jgi:hypothetical protein
VLMHPVSWNLYPRSDREGAAQTTRCQCLPPSDIHQQHHPYILFNRSINSLLVAFPLESLIIVFPSHLPCFTPPSHVALIPSALASTHRLLTPEEIARRNPSPHESITLSGSRGSSSGLTAPPLTQSTHSSTEHLPSANDEQAPPSFSSLFSTPESAESAAAAASKARSFNSPTPPPVVAARTPTPTPPGTATTVDNESVIRHAVEDDDEEEADEDEDAILPSFSSAVSGPQPSSSAFAAAAAAARVVADTKAALPRDTKDAAAGSASLDDGEPPPPYSEGSSPIRSFTYVMATAGGPASIITQVSQTSTAPVGVLGGEIYSYMRFRRSMLILFGSCGIR